MRRITTTILRIDCDGRERIVDGLLVVFDVHMASRRMHCEFAPPSNDFAADVIKMLQTDHFRHFL